MSRVVQMMRTGDFNPHFFDYPGLYFYVQLGVAVLRFLAGRDARRVERARPGRDADFYLWGRAVTALLRHADGPARLPHRHALGRAARGARRRPHGGHAAPRPRVALRADRRAGHVLRHADAPAHAGAHERERAAGFAWAGAAAGLAAATKYPGGSRPRRAAHRRLDDARAPSRRGSSPRSPSSAAPPPRSWSPLPTPSWICPAFLNGYAHLAGYYTPKRLAEPAWLTYYKHLSRSMDWPAFLLLARPGSAWAPSARSAAPGACAGRSRSPFRCSTTISSRARRSSSDATCCRSCRSSACSPPSARSRASACCAASTSRARRAPPIIAALTAAALLPPAWQSLGFIRTIARTSTVEQAHAWILSDIPKGASIVIETQALLLSPQELTRRRTCRSSSSTPGLRATTTDYVKAGVDYIVASSQKYGDALTRPKDYPELYDAYTRLFGQSQEVMRFTPSEEHPGPEIRVFRLR